MVSQSAYPPSASKGVVVEPLDGTAPYHITKQGNGLLRGLLVEAAHTAVRGDAELGRCCRRLAMKRNRSPWRWRKLAVRLWWMWVFADSDTENYASPVRMQSKPDRAPGVKSILATVNGRSASLEGRGSLKRKSWSRTMGSNTWLVGPVLTERLSRRALVGNSKSNSNSTNKNTGEEERQKQPQPHPFAEVCLTTPIWLYKVHGGPRGLEQSLPKN